MTWRVAKSLLKLRDQVDEASPSRSKGWDGTIGDERHQAEKTSDHNPWVKDGDVGVVTALDITHDPAHGVDSYALAETLRLARDPRVKYIISNKRICNPKIQANAWRPYNGSNPHDHHVHISVYDDKQLYDSAQPWYIGSLGQGAPKMPTGLTDETFVGIIATVFGGSTEVESSAYDGHRIANDEMCVALPARFASPPLVEVTNQANGKRVTCRVADIGPWNISDPYWGKTGGRPQAETGIDNTGRKTNRAGIDLSPAAANAIGLIGMGTVNWRFIVVPAKAPVTPKSTIPPPTSTAAKTAGPVVVIAGGAAAAVSAGVPWWQIAIGIVIAIGAVALVYRFVGRKS